MKNKKTNTIIKICLKKVINIKKKNLKKLDQAKKKTSSKNKN